MKTASLPQSIEILRLASDLTTKQMGDLLSSGILSDVFDVAKEGLIGRIDRQELRFVAGLDWRTCSLTMDYDVPLDQLMEWGRRKVYSKIWHCDSSDMQFNRGTGVSGRRRLEIQAFRLIKTVKYAGVRAFMADKKLRPLTIEELITLNLDQPGFAESVVALGTLMTFVRSGLMFYPQSTKTVGVDESLPLKLNIVGAEGESHFREWYACTSLE